MSFTPTELPEDDKAYLRDLYLRLKPVDAKLAQMNIADPHDTVADFKNHLDLAVTYLGALIQQLDSGRRS